MRPPSSGGACLLRRIGIWARISQPAGAFLPRPGKIRPRPGHARTPGWKDAPSVPDLLEKRLLFVTGKGVVGKSTIALALGLRAAAAGKRVIVCEVAGQETASRVFRKGEIGFN